jgi:hypothetical protein
MKRMFVPVAVLAAVGLWACDSAGPVSPDMDSSLNNAPHQQQGNSVTYSGQGTYLDGDVRKVSTEICGIEEGAEVDGEYLLWILTANGATSATLHGAPDGIAPYADGVMVKAGGANSVWKYVSEYPEDLDALIGAVSATWTGTARGNVQLVISHGCGAPPVVILENLTVVKTAAGSYDRDYSWTLTKHVDGVASKAFAGGLGSVHNWQWQVAATLSVVEDNYEVTGSITITNPNPIPVTVAVDDVLDDGTVAAVTCAMVDGDIVVPANGNLVCSYTASPTDAEATYNRVDVEVLSYDPPENWDEESTIEGGFATADIDWSANVSGDAQVTLADVLVGYSQLISATTTPNFDDSYTCPTDLEEYEDGVHVKTIVNTATLTGDNTDLSASATVTVTCTLGTNTAWAANGDEPGQLPVYPGGGNWATYVEYFGAQKTVSFFAGQTHYVGTVTFSAPVDGMVTITVNLENASFKAGEVLAVQDYATAPINVNTAPGQFDHKVDATGTTAQIVVPANNFYIVHGVVHN